MERWLLVLIVASLGFAYTTTIESKTEGNYLRCKSGFNCYIKPAPAKTQAKIQAKPRNKPFIKRKTK